MTQLVFRSRIAHAGYDAGGNYCEISSVTAHPIETQDFFGYAVKSVSVQSVAEAYSAADLRVTLEKIYPEGWIEVPGVECESDREYDLAEILADLAAIDLSMMV